MALIKYKLGELIELVDERNSYGLRNFHGVNIDKEFMPTVADTSTLNETKYKVVRKNRFACNLMHVGRDVAIPIAFHRDDASIIVSPAYFTFEVTATNKILPEYFFMLFLSKEKDRLGWFLSDSSVRANLEWKTFCDIEINLPPLAVQKKFVAVYNALLENKKAYERGLDDLKLVCNGFIENLRRNMPCEKIGKYIRAVNERNENHAVILFQGVNVDHVFTDPKRIAEDAENGNIVRMGQFAFNKVMKAKGTKLPIALREGADCVVSSSYEVFEVIDKERLLPQYLMLWMNRAETQRYAGFISFGTTRDIFSFADLCAVEIPIPDLKIQRSIAAVYEVLRTRQKILERLKAQIKDICPILIKGSLDEGTMT